MAASHPAIKRYYQAIKELGHQGVSHELGMRRAFEQLLAETARVHDWTLVSEDSIRTSTGAVIRPDGTLRDQWQLSRGWWEAKDTADNLDAEISRKRQRGYPLSNTIFEDTREAVLFQRVPIQRFKLDDPAQVAALLNQFFGHVEAPVEEFHHAVSEFQEKVPVLASQLANRIAEAHETNRRFQDAFNDFFELCKSSLNPNIRRDAVDEMLVQHILTERVIEKVFDNSDFKSRNAIAVEVEKVCAALFSKEPSRNAFLKSLDPFYDAIERAAETQTDFSEKQHFLDHVYERFFQGYSVKVADTHGIVYTPQPIVDFMCASVEEVLEKEFGKKLGDPGVNILDPCTGTGNFVVNLLRRIAEKNPSRLTPAYREQLFANEVMLMPYYIAALNIEHAYYELKREYETFEGICFVDTLDIAEDRDQAEDWITALSEKNAERVTRQKRTPITVIVGNPPYNVGQLSENDNNKNRKYKVIDRRVKDTYGKDSSAINKNSLSDPYVKFFRWAADRLHGKGGIVCYVSNNSFVDQIAFDGMRKHLLSDFDTVYHLDLHGNVRTNPKISGTSHNVFGIQVGVGITIAIKTPKNSKKQLYYHKLPHNALRREKLEWLCNTTSIKDVQWQPITPSQDYIWISSNNFDEFKSHFTLANKAAKEALKGEVQATFKIYSPGTQTNRDEWVYNFQRNSLARRVAGLIEVYNGEVDRWIRAGKPEDIDTFVCSDPAQIKWSSKLKELFFREIKTNFDNSKIRIAMYRPFTQLYLYFDSSTNHRRGRVPGMFPTSESESKNFVICTTHNLQIPFSAIIVSLIPDVCLGGRPGQCFPFYVYDEDGTNRRENITDWALDQYRTHYADKTITKEDIFYYVYGILHHPGYRERYADCLKRELPRIPFAPDFRAFSDTGRKLAGLHLNYESLPEYPLDRIYAPGVPYTPRVEKMKLSKDKTTLTVNQSLTLRGIPPETFQYRLGNRSALDWVIDQYRVTENPKTGYTSDPNRPDDPEYIIRLVGQVVYVSVDTVKLVNALPPFWAKEAVQC